MARCGSVRRRGWPGPMKPSEAGEIEGDGGRGNGQSGRGCMVEEGPALLAVKLPLPMRMGGNGRTRPTPACRSEARRGSPCCLHLLGRTC